MKMIHSNINYKFILLLVNLWYVCVCFAHVIPGSNVGDSCIVAENNIAGTCKLLQNCPRAIKLKELNKPIQYCGKEENLKVCCPNIGEITEQKCVEYGKEVWSLVGSSTFLLGAPKTNQSTCVNEGTGFIIGGVDAKAKEFPHMALLGFGPEENKTWLCGGALISNQYVLTAAHCIYSRVFNSNVKWIRLGELNKEEEYDTYREDFGIEKIIRHPHYEIPSKYHDIALILLDDEVHFSPNIRPACLNTLPLLEKDTKMIATGWGHTGDPRKTANHLQKVTLQQYTNEECNLPYKKKSYLRNLPKGITNTQMCAGDRESIKDTCGGDSGGPLQIYHPKVFCMLSIAGVTSFGKADCNKTERVPGVYVRVSEYLEWIENIVWI